MIESNFTNFNSPDEGKRVADALDRGEEVVIRLPAGTSNREARHYFKSIFRETRKAAGNKLLEDFFGPLPKIDPLWREHGIREELGQFLLLFSEEKAAAIRHLVTGDYSDAEYLFTDPTEDLYPEA